MRVRRARQLGATATLEEVEQLRRMCRDGERKGEAPGTLTTRVPGEQLRRARASERGSHVRQPRVVPGERSAGRIREPEMDHHDMVVRARRKLIVRVPVIVP